MLDSLIFVDVEPTQFINKNFDSDKFGHWKAIAEDENHRIKKALRNAAFSQAKEKYVEKYIQQHQQELIILTDQLLDYLPEEEANSICKITGEETLLNLYKVIYQNLSDLLEYIEKHFSKYFNLDAALPTSYRIIAIQEIEEMVGEVKYRLESREADKNLLSIILSPLLNFVDKKNLKAVSFRRLIFLKELLKELDELSGVLQEEDQNRQVISTVIYLNFNSYRLFLRCAEIIQIDYQNQETLLDQINCLAFWYKNISQTPVKPGTAFKPESQTLKVSLIEWLEDEIHYLEKKRQLSLNLSVAEVQVARKDYKLSTNLSVPQLAYLLKILVETGVILNKNQREVIKFVSGGFRTKKAESVSPDSLRSKFYNVEDNTRSVVKDLLITMLNHVRKN